jgi:lambda family phage portal protein
MIKLSDYLHIPGMGRVLDDAERSKPAKQAKRDYAAAKVNRLNADWTATPYAVNWTLYRNLRILRARARQMAKDAPHFKKFLRMVRTNVIGPKGLQLMVRARGMDGKSLNAELNKRVADTFWEWTFRENCSASQKLNWLGAQRLFVTHLARDGEVLVQHVPANNAFGYALKFINVDYLDETFNQTLPASGNRVIMSVEIDANDRPVAYWLTTPTSEINFTQRRERTRTRVPAEEMTHAFLVLDDESQTRGVTWFAASLLEGKNLESYKNGVITSARMAALNMGFITSDTADETEFTGEEDDDGNELPIEINIGPASFTELRPGQKVEQFDPKQPTQNHAEFKKTILEDIAAGLDLPYFSLTGDMTAVNYSSARVGQADERDVWRELQDFVGDMFCREVYHRWVRAAMVSGKLKVTAKEFKEIQNPMWRPRGWRYVDPQKEITATVTAIENKLMTWTDALAEQGIDITEHFETLQQEQELAAKYDIDLSIASKAAPSPAADDPNADDTKPPPKKDNTGRGYSNGEYHEEADIVN